MENDMLFRVLMVALLASGCAIKVKPEDPITINLNVNIQHDIRVKVDKEIEDLFDNEEEDLF